MFETKITDNVLVCSRPDTIWLSTGWHGGQRMADTAYSVSVPNGWYPDDLEIDLTNRLVDAGLLEPETGSIGHSAPVLITGVDMAHARGARFGPVVVYATAGVSNPAALPMEPTDSRTPGKSEDQVTGEIGTANGNGPDNENDFAGGDDFDDRNDVTGGNDFDESNRSDAGTDSDEPPQVGTVNLIVGTTLALQDGALANLVAVAAEAKAATLLHEVGTPGTTSDAVIIASDPAGAPTEYSGSATEVGRATRACVRDAIRASLASRYDAKTPPESVGAADHGVRTDCRADVFRP